MDLEGGKKVGSWIIILGSGAGMMIGIILSVLSAIGVIKPFDLLGYAGGLGVLVGVPAAVLAGHAGALSYIQVKAERNENAGNSGAS